MSGYSPLPLNMLAVNSMSYDDSQIQVFLFFFNNLSTAGWIEFSRI